MSNKPTFFAVANKDGSVTMTSEGGSRAFFVQTRGPLAVRDLPKFFPKRNDHPRTRRLVRQLLGLAKEYRRSQSDPRVTGS